MTQSSYLNQLEPQTDHAVGALAAKLDDYIGKDLDGGMILGKLRFIRRISHARPVSVVTQPSVSLVVSGFKEAELTTSTVAYGAGSVFLCGVDMPDRFTVRGTSSDPFLALSMPIDEDLLNAALEKLGQNIPTPNAPTDDLGSVFIYPADDTLVGAFDRLFEAERMQAGRPCAFSTAILELRREEILLHALNGRGGMALRRLFHAGTPENRIRRSILWLREHYREEFGIEDLADRIGMSPAAFYRHFQAVLGASPRRYVTMLRLFEGKRLIQEEGLSAAAASCEVGYASPSHFSRAYKELFGTPPLAHALQCDCETSE